MPVSAPDLLANLEARGLVHNSTDRDALAARLDQGRVTVYAGFDPTADSLHIGSLLGLVTLRRFQQAGHRPLALVGGATGMVGDPSGRSDERNVLEAEVLAANLQGIGEQIARFIEIGDGPTDAHLVDNATWTAPIGLLDFLGNVGRHVTLNQMLAKESVKSRMASASGISFAEFSYMLLQANDYWWLHEHEACELQIGGSDQWGNITAGIDLIRRRCARSVHGLTWPLIKRSDGVKMGKSQSGAVWLSADRTSPYQFFQWWMHVPDADVEPFLLGFTLMPVAEIQALMAEHSADPAARCGQRRLARELTTLVHGSELAAAAEAASAVLFGGSLDRADGPTLAAVAAEVPNLEVLPGELAAGLDLIDVIVGTGLTASRGETRRVIQQGGASVNNRRAGEGRVLDNTDLVGGRYVLVRKGKRDYAVVVLGG